MFATLPLLALPVIGYNLLIFTLTPGGRRGSADALMLGPMLRVPMASGGQWTVTPGDLVTAISLVILFVELLKSTGSRHIAIINHSLSMLLFIACLVEFLLFRAFATSAFFLVTLMVLLDVLAGFVMTIVTARRAGGD